MTKKLSILVVLTGTILLSLPLVVLGFDPPPLPNGGPGFPINFDKIFDFIWPLFEGFAILMFLVAGFLFLSANGDPTKIKTAKQALIWGIIGVIVGILAFSIPLIISSLF